MHSLAARALRTIRRHDLIPRGARVIAAVSGGPDSVALSLILRQLDAAGELIFAGLAHVNHHLRASASRDEAFSLDFAARLDRPIEIAHVDVAPLVAARRTSTEDAARVARYDALRDAMTRLDAVRVAVGHMRDDQAETFLQHTIRGAGSRGRRGIHPRRDVFVRPLLDIGRDELREFLREADAPFCHDETNDDVAIERNRVRHELIPLLKARFSPGIVGVLARNAEIASADEAYLDARAQELFARIVRVGAAARLEIDAARLAGEPPALAWRVALMALEYSPTPFNPPRRQSLGFDHAETLVAMAAGVAPCRIDLPGVRAERIGPQLVLIKKAGRRLLGGSRNSFHYALSIPGEVWLRESDCAIAAQPMSPEAADALAGTRSDRVAMVSAAALSASLAVRSRRPGDAFRPLGLGGRKKLQDFFVDRKVAREGRDRVPLVVDEHDRIVWVAGHAISEEFRVTDRRQAVVILRLKTLADAADPTRPR